MSGYFETKLWELLRDLDREETRKQAEELSLPEGDLQAFIKVVAPTLDDLKYLTDRFPELADPDNCLEEFLPHLAALVGQELLLNRTVSFHRKRLKTAVEEYRRKGTHPSVRFDFRMHGLDGDVEETFREALRLNRRAKLNQANLAGKVFNQGVYRVRTSSPVADVRQVLGNTQPAGTRLFISQRFREAFFPLEETVTRVSRTVRNTALAYSSLVLKPARHPLRGGYRLTTHRHTWNGTAVRLSQSAALTPQPSTQRTVSMGGVLGYQPAWAGNLLTVVQFS